MPAPEDTFHLFVYGTLKRGGVRHGVLVGARPRGEARTRPLYALYDLGDYPGLVPCADDGQSIEGELYEVDQTMIARLDEIEGAPDWFALGPVEVSGGTEGARAYFFQGDVTGRPRVESGVWPNAPGKGGAP